MRRIPAVTLATLLGLVGLTTAKADETKKMTVFKTPWCGCCTAWTEAMQHQGYKVAIRDLEDLTTIKTQAGVPDNLQVCHTVALGDYVLEGHVPVAAVEKLMSERPAIRGIAVPGMPAGSLGMGDDPKARYQVFAFDRDATAPPRVFFEVGE